MKPLLALGMALTALGILLGAFGAHALKASLNPSQLQTWETAVRYHLVWALGLQILAVQPGGPRWNWPLLCLLGGGLVFSGSLYLLCLTQIRWLGALTPLGGLGLIAGWSGLAWETLRRD